MLRGQIVKACVVLRPGVNPGNGLKTELQVHCKKLIAAYKYPREIEFVRELPKTTSGKTRHVELRQTKTTTQA
jgi:acyl-coenzyme A synthetase/AMP-(fatty) acid ligase